MAWVGGATAAVGAVSYLTLNAQGWNDYEVEARPAFDALVNGHLHRFLELAPAYAGSLMLRAPFVLLAHALGGDQAWLYRASAIPCFVAVALLALWLVRRLRRAGAGKRAQVLVLVICVLNPLTIQAVRWGHPEDVLGAALCVGAVLAAIEDRPWWAGLLLGLAIANKEWALLAVGPVLIALPGRRPRAAVIAAGVAALLMLPFVLAQASASGQAVVGGTGPSSVFQRWDIWWFLGTPRHIPGVHGPLYLSARTGPGWLAGVTHLMIVVLGLALSGMYGWLCARTRRHRPADALLLLALLLLLRCVLDPWDFVYYPLPFLVALASWEAVRMKRPPLLAMAASVLAWLTMQETAMPILGISQDAQSLIFLAFALPALAVTGSALLRPVRAPLLGAGATDYRGASALRHARLARHTS